MNMPSEGDKEEERLHREGTLAIDLGNSTTVVAFQGEKESEAKLLNLHPITRLNGEIPSLVWTQSSDTEKALVGNQVINLEASLKNSSSLISDFKRWIGTSYPSHLPKKNISPEKAGEVLINNIWENIPNDITVRRLVLTAPVETYRAYRAWLVKACSNLPVNEIALVDEPTAAAMGAGLLPGSKLLVIDFGGSTIDLSLVALEGGEGRAEPVAQLLRFEGKSLEGNSKQILRCAKVLGKAGIRLGGRDLDRWIANFLMPNEPIDEILLNTAEKLKCRLSEKGLEDTKLISERINQNSEDNLKELLLSKEKFEELIIKNGFLKTLDKLLEAALAGARANNCKIDDLDGVVAVGGGSRIPLVQKWLEAKFKTINLLKPPPIEAVAIGALKLTPGVKIKDILQRGVSIRCWQRRSNSYIWHPLFLAGQPWPTSNDLEIILAASKNDQSEIELVIGEPDVNSINEVIYIDGIPKIVDEVKESTVNPWPGQSISIELTPKGKIGENCIKLRFRINDNCLLEVVSEDLRNGEVSEKMVLGSVR